MENNMTIREMLYREETAFAVEEQYKESVEDFMETQRIKYKKKYVLGLPEVGLFYVYMIWSAGEIQASEYAVKRYLRELREQSSKKVEG